METKVCSKCKENKKVCEFGNSKSSEDGLLYCCKKCNNERSKIYRNENYQKTLEQHRKWTAKNPEWVYNRHKKWREGNTGKVKELRKKKISLRRSMGVAEYERLLAKGREAYGIKIKKKV